MTRATSRTARRLVVSVVVGLAATALVSAPNATAEGDGLPPVVASPSTAVTADALPTAQIDGVVWTQRIVGDTVYAGGEFTRARPAGKAPGRGEVRRTNLLSYSLSTGQLTSWAPRVNGAVRDLEVSPDGSTLYVAGSFTAFDGQKRSRLATVDLATATLVPTFAPAFDYTVNTVVVTANRVYAGGAFHRVGTVERDNLAAVTTAGALTSWDPGADAEVHALLLAPGGGGVLVVGGAFSELGSGTSTGDATAALGLGAVRTGTGAVVPWPANQRVQDHGGNSAILDLTTDGSLVYAAGYVYNGSGNLEGVVATDRTGKIVWVEDCHGDTYGLFATAGLVYTVSHAHNCSTVGGFADTDPMTHYPAMAFTKAVKGVLGHNTVPGYADWGGTPAPSITGWFPTLAAGTYTGQTQAAWSVTGNDRYVVLGGEFPSVNGVPQQGLVRFAVPGTAPNQVGPRYGGSQVPLTLTPQGRSVTVSWPANTDADDLRLTYAVVRDGVTVGTVTARSTPWDRPTLTFTDTRVPTGTHAYQVRASDADDNRAWSDPVPVTVP